MNSATASLTFCAGAGDGTGLSTIPTDASGVTGNVTAADYTGPGFLSVTPQAVAYNPVADPSTVNFILGQAAIANSFTCGLNNGQLQVYVGSSSSHFIVDITGYIQ